MIFVFGSINQDTVYQLLQMPRLGETVMSQKCYKSLGGKGANQAIAIAKMDGDVALIARVGSDGGQLIDRLAAFNVDTKYIKIDEDSDTGSATIFVIGGDNCIVLQNGANFKLTGDDANNALTQAKPGDIMLCQLETKIAEVEKVFKLAKQKGMTTVLNPAPACKIDKQLYQLTDIIAPNETETEILTGINPIDDSSIESAINCFIKNGISKGVITLSARGSVCFDDGIINKIPAKKVKVVDTTAAGDTFIGAMCLHLDKGIENACKIATVASSITVTRAGASQSIPTKHEIEIALKN